MTQILSPKYIAPDMFEDILLREQLHRFSNSFQIVAALARQCSRKSGAHDTASMLEALEDRLHSLTTLHRLLATNFEMPDFAGRVHEIARKLVRSFGRTDGVILHVDRFWLPEQHRFRLGLIVSELVTNALKHSLYSCAEGLIEISVRTSGCSIILTVVDSNRKALNGRRLLPSPIVAGLAESIGGVAEVVDQNGYAARVTLPREERPFEIIEGSWTRPAMMPAMTSAALH